MGNTTLPPLIRGDSRTFSLTLTNKATGLPYNITGWTFYFTIKANITDLDADALLQKVVTTHTDAAAGKTDISIDPADTAGVEPGNYFYDIQAVTDTDDVHTICKGAITIDWDATLIYGTAGTAGTAGTGS